MSSVTFFDTLLLIGRLEELYGDTSLGELLVFAYLAYILHRYGGGLGSDWGYSFSSTEFGTPFSQLVAETVSSCSDGGFISTGDSIRLTETGRAWLTQLTRFDFYEDRMSSLNAAADVGLFVTSGNLRRLLEQEASLAAARQEGRPRLIPDPSSHLLLEGQFERLLRGMGRTGVPKIVAGAAWLKTLDAEGNQPI